MRRRTTALLITGLLAGSIAAAGPAAAGKGPSAKATLWVVHGVPGATVEICVDGAEVRSGFEYGQRFSARLPAGTYDVEVRADDPATCEGAKVLAASPTLEANKNYTAVAGLASAGAPKLFLFRNEVRAVTDDYARLTVRHTAAAPKVDVLVNGRALLQDFSNGDEATVRVREDDYRVRVNVANTKTTAIGPKTLDLEDGRAYQVFAVGNGDAGYRLLVLSEAVGTK